MNPYVQLVDDHARWFRDGRNLPLGGFPVPTRPTPAADAPLAMIFSPHPDDECIEGGLPLRLQMECGWRVTNVAVTQGSRRDRQAARLEELRAACRHLGFGLETIGERGLEFVTPQARKDDPAGWTEKVRTIAGILKRHRPRLILYPQKKDWNATHIGVHLLVLDALAYLGSDFQCNLLETEFWGQNYNPNLLVEIPSPVLVDLVTALTFHAGEVHRNPYHLTLAAWMMNNVRLGGETVGGQGAAPPDFPFGTVYRLRRWADGWVQDIYKGGRILRATDDPSALLS